LRAGPFEPFAIITSSGHRYEVPTADHAQVSPKGSQVVIWFDNGGSLTLSMLHVVALESAAPSGKN
jgi:hypothetical protein